VNDEEKFASKFYHKQNTITTQSYDGFANKTISWEGLSGFVKLFSDLTNQMQAQQQHNKRFTALCPGLPR